VLRGSLRGRDVGMAVIGRAIAAFEKNISGQFVE
jgi:hypothetical protein